MKACVLVLLVALTATASAEREYHLGIDARTDLGTHPVRPAIGIRTCAWDTTLVFDPMYLADGEHDLDLLAEWYPNAKLALLLGWRWTVVHLSEGHHQQQRSLLGVTGVGPRFFGGRLRTSASLEFSTLWVSHGGGEGAQWFGGDRNFLDRLALGLFVRIELAR